MTPFWYGIYGWVYFSVACGFAAAAKTNKEPNGWAWLLAMAWPLVILITFGWRLYEATPRESAKR